MSIKQILISLRGYIETIPVQYELGRIMKNCLGVSDLVRQRFGCIAIKKDSRFEILHEIVLRPHNNNNILISFMFVGLSCTIISQVSVLEAVFLME